MKVFPSTFAVITAVLLLTACIVPKFFELEVALSAHATLLLELDHFTTFFAWILALMMIFSVFTATQVNAATKPKLSKTKITMTVGQSKKLKVKGISKKRAKRIKWKSSKKKVVTVTKTGKLKARKAGKATITAKVGKKKLKCKVVVKRKRKKARKKKESNSSSKKMWLSKTSVTLQAGSGVDLVLLVAFVFIVKTPFII